MLQGKFLHGLLFEMSNVYGVEERAAGLGKEISSEMTSNCI